MMFSNFTSQVSQMSSWIGAKRGEGDMGKEEKVPTPTGDPDMAPPTDGISPTGKSGSKLDVLSNVKGQMSNLIGGVQLPSVSVPSFFSKGGEGGAPGAEGDLKVDSPTSGESIKGSPEQKEEDDNSRFLEKTNVAIKQATASATEYFRVKFAQLSATGGADSDAVAEEEEAAGEEGKEGAIGGVSTKAVAGAKTIGNFLFSAVNRAGETVSKAGAKIKKTVEENTLLGEFNKEQEAFINEKDGQATDAAVPPWVGVPNEEALKEECLSLSTDRRNFVRAPPPGVDFPFEYDTSYKVALATLSEDPNLEKMRFELVPKVVSEENFWRNYFYRVALLRQQAELNAMEPCQPSRTSSVDVEPTEEWEKELEAELKDYEVVAETTSQGTTLDEELDDLK